MSDGDLDPRWIVANLDCESDFARACGLRRQPLTRAALAAVAGAGTLLRVFAHEGDRLWLPAPVAPGRLAEIPGLPGPVLASGPLNGAGVAGEIVAWGETADVARRRAAAARRAPGPGTPLHRLPWRLPPASPEAAAGVNDRRFCLAVAEELGCRLPGARVVASARELAEHLEAGGADAAAGRWILKAPFSAAGRWRHLHRGGIVERRPVEGLFRRHGELIFEPWMERTADFGCAAALTPGGALTLSHHRLLVDRRGGFTGIELPAADRSAEAAGLDGEERAALARVVDGVAMALGRAGYRGPFGIDAWRYRAADGGEAFQPLGEINARMTFGLVARALVERLRVPLRLDAGDRVRLLFGRGAKRSLASVVPLLRAERRGDREIWLEISSPGRRDASVLQGRSSERRRRPFDDAGSPV